MTSRSRTLTIALVLGFVAFLLWTTLSAQRVECTVTVEFQGNRRSATASGATEKEALDQAQNVACGPMSSGMDESIACSNRQPVTKQCRPL
jgi:hypothetical protein